MKKPVQIGEKVYTFAIRKVESYERESLRQQFEIQSEGCDLFLVERDGARVCCLEGAMAFAVSAIHLKDEESFPGVMAMLKEVARSSGGNVMLAISKHDERKREAARVSGAVPISRKTKALYEFRTV